MDIYLPADFREIHDAAPDDWRDASSSCRSPARMPHADDDVADPAGLCADPLWRVF